MTFDIHSYQIINIKFIGVVSAKSVARYFAALLVAWIKGIASNLAKMHSTAS